MASFIRRNTAIIVLGAALLLVVARGLQQWRERAAPAAVPPLAAAPIASQFDIPSNAVAATVTRVIDGDTIVAEIGGKSEHVRYIGINTPELHHPDKGVEYFGAQAAAANRKLVAGQTVELTYDVTRRDRYGRLLAYVFVAPQTFVNAWLVEAGYAHAYTFPPNVRYTELFRRLQADAYRAARGLWAHNDPGPPLTPAQAAHHIYEYRAVQGEVVRTYADAQSGMVILDFSVHPGFSAVIEPDDLAHFPPHPERAYLHHRLWVAGRINTYRGRPEMELIEPAQVRVLDQHP